MAAMVCFDVRLQYFGLSIRFRRWGPLTEKLVRGPFAVKIFTYLCGFDRFWSVWYNNLLQNAVKRGARLV